MANRINEVLNAAGLKLPIFCQGMTRVGLSIQGTWTGAVNFEGTYDGVNWQQINMGVFGSTANPPATANSATANGNWEAFVQNYMAMRANLTTLLTGSPAISLAASLDASYQDAFLTPSTRYVNAVSAANSTVTLTKAASTNRAWRLRTLWISVSAAATWASSPNLQIKDGSTVIWQGDIPVAIGGYLVPLPADPNTPGVVGGGLVNTPGNAMSIVLPAAGSGIIANINAEFVPA